MVHLFQCSSSVHTLLLSFSILLLLTSSMELAFSDARSLPLRPVVPEDTVGATDKAVSVTPDDNKQESAAAARSISRGGKETEAAGRHQRRRALIGSRPPRCERVCMSCGHCEAVQVPIVPQQEKEKETEEKVRSAADAVTVTAAMFTYRVDGITNYKPLSWKCRCGDTILDP